MSKVIEISDSDDESERMVTSSEVGNFQPVDVPTINSSSAENLSTIAVETAVATSGRTSPLPLIISEVISMNTSPLPTIVSVHGSPATNSSSTPSAASTSSAANIQPNKRSRRKSMHHPLCASPEIEFETIALDDDEDNTPSKAKNKNHTTDIVQQIKSPKSHKTSPKILNTKPTDGNISKKLADARNDFLMSDETNALLRQIAEDRVRINFLLASYNMPEIQFSLHTKPEVLQFQLEERIKHRRRRCQEASNQLKKRRSLLQNSNSRTGS
ncbi:uncharacterized protein LOC118732972 [Rhagoletis pomonella]|uniref:uncharacterized protein LOC118732972 n=1 Tax=Rhagoletis pomonella TaxID=28610 RepID=UPI0017868C76|nr:uncharacterized protein LOC118732972 [Rhagoletis pomonella]